MTTQWFQTTTPDLIEALFEELIDQSSEEEHVAMLFNLLQNCLNLAARGAETDQADLQKDGVVGAVAILSFLREHLRTESRDPANGVFRRFYNAAHRQILKAHQQEDVARLRDIRASIAKVIQKPYSSSFFHNCMQETVMNRGSLLRLLMTPEVRQLLCRIDDSERIFAGEPDRR
jgi:flagellin-specific chaperone FliS